VQDTLRLMVGAIILISLVMLGAMNLLNRIIENKYIRRLIKIIVYIVAAFLVVLGQLLCLISAVGEGIRIEEDKERYGHHISKFERSIKSYRTKHFPSKLPSPISDYHFIPYGGNLDHKVGYNFFIYVRFTEYGNYADNTLEKNKSNIYSINEWDKYNQFDMIETETPKDKYDLYILKNEHNDNGYTSGIMVNKKTHEIVFFCLNEDMLKPEYREERDKAQNIKHNLRKESKNIIPKILSQYPA